MTKAPYDVWLTQVKDVLELQGIDWRDAFDVYAFHVAWDQYDLTPEDAVADYRMCKESVK